VEREGEEIGSLGAKMVSCLPQSTIDLLLIADFALPKIAPGLREWAPRGCKIVDLSTLTLSPSWLTVPQTYLDPLNFATNFAFFRDTEETFTRLTTANYWHRYGARSVQLSCLLFDTHGELLASWKIPLEDREHLIVLDSREIRQRFSLPPFTGQLFLHAQGVKGHDILKYALDIESPTGAVLGSTHDANPFPSAYFAGLPAPREDEEVILWIQNSHPVPIPPHTIRVQLMGQDDVAWTLPQEVPPFASVPVSVRTHLPQVSWPQQLEVWGGYYCVRPRYEVVTSKGRRTICHINVERDTLKPDPKWLSLSRHFGKGYLLPFPLLPLDQFEQRVIPTPMSRHQNQLSLQLRAYDETGALRGIQSLGPFLRATAPEVVVNDWLEGYQGAGHLELSYAHDPLGEVDGWLHGLFRYRHKETNHPAETTFGSHLFNHPLTYKGEPHAYSGPPPGLSTRLFLRVGGPGYRTFCHLIYPVSDKWNAYSETTLGWLSASGETLGTTNLRIPASGSRLVWADELFPTLGHYPERSYIIVRDTTCRLFGYHGLVEDRKGWTLDHMFGF
jgi:hypothetical protein